MKYNRCEKCRHFVSDSPTVKAEMQGNGRIEMYGDCRRYPPIVLTQPPPTTAPFAKPTILYRWPHVAKEDGCGEFAVQVPD
jgi:hypothetical protein